MENMRKLNEKTDYFKIKLLTFYIHIIITLLIIDIIYIYMQQIS